MARRIELEDDALVLHYDRLGALLRAAGDVRVPYDAIVALSVGVDRLPHPFAMRVGVNGWPTDVRRGQFWADGKRMFYDVGDRKRALVLELRNQPFARVVFEPDTSPERLADELRERAPWLRAP